MPWSWWLWRCAPCSMLVTKCCNALSGRREWRWHRLIFIWGWVYSIYNPYMEGTSFLIISYIDQLEEFNDISGLDTKVEASTMVSISFLDCLYTTHMVQKYQCIHPSKRSPRVSGWFVPITRTDSRIQRQWVCYKYVLPMANNAENKRFYSIILARNMELESWGGQMEGAHNRRPKLEG